MLPNYWVVPKYERLAEINYALSCNLVTCVPKKSPCLAKYVTPLFLDVVSGLKLSTS